MIDLKQLKALIRLMVENDLTELDLQDEKGEKVKLKRGGDESNLRYVTAPPMHAAPSAAPPPAAAPSGPAPAAPADKGDEGLITIKSPMVGTFYASPSPDAASFVNVGDRVSADTVVCLVEAMKVFNEIKAETSGTIAAVLVNNGEAVEHDQPLFKVKPS